MTNIVGLTFTVSNCIKLSASIICFFEHKHSLYRYSWHRNGELASEEWMHNVLLLQIWISDSAYTPIHKQGCQEYPLFEMGLTRNKWIQWYHALGDCLSLASLSQYLTIYPFSLNWTFKSFSTSLLTKRELTCNLNMRNTSLIRIWLILIFTIASTIMDFITIVWTILLSPKYILHGAITSYMLDVPLVETSRIYNLFAHALGICPIMLWAVELPPTAKRLTIEYFNTKQKLNNRDD